MKKTTLIYTLFAFWLYQCHTPNEPTAIENNYPLPTGGETEQYDQHEEGKGKGNARRAWNELKHKAAPGVDWRAIERQNVLENYQLKKKLERSGATKNPEETLANGNLIGKWLERGSNNQAGSLREIDYDPATDQIYSVSDGGTIWRSNLAGTTWTPLNENFQFSGAIMNVIPNGNGTNRILASLGKVIHYSDDEGQTWIPSTGFNFYDNWGGPKKMYALNDNQTIYYLVKTWSEDPWGAAVWLFYSDDRGTTFQQIAAYQQGQDKRIDLWSPFDSDEAYLIVNGADLYGLSDTDVNLLNSNMDLPATQNVHLNGALVNDNPVFYTLMNGDTLYRSNDLGDNWTKIGTTPVKSWDVGLHVASFDADKVFFGAVNCYQSSNQGVSWSEVNGWGQYYSDIDKLHADIMDIKSFKKTDGTEFMLVSNHGGIHVSYDTLLTTTNIGKEGLNISQYYDVRTQPNDVNFYYAGSQDQGHQRSGDATSEGASDFVQVLSGDYGQMVFSRNGDNLWTVYPGGAVHYYDDPQTQARDGGYNVGGEHPPVRDWINPTSEALALNSNKMYVAGGNINGGPGSYLVELTANESAPYSVTATQFNYDFRANSNNGTSTISAIETSEVDADRIYVATSDGTFFYSQNAGTTWTKTSNFTGPTESWITPTSIYASKLTSNLVWFGGSGYSNPGVYKSTDGGQTFTGMANGLPATVVNELVANTAETMLFAATDAGPYVYIVAEDMWYNILGMYAPVQNYQSVEYIAGLDIIRFGTYGRGIWDFKISCQLSTFYADADGDGYGDPNVSIQACSAPVNYVTNNTDCEDGDANAYPGTSTQEICDGLDNNCNGQIDEGFDTACGDYCDPQHFGGLNDYIVRVELGMIDNSSGGYTSNINGYSDFTNVKTDVSVGTTYQLTVTPNFSFNLSTFGVWIDWNKNSVFDESERIVALREKGPWTVDITVPNDAFNGTVRMRIRQQYSPTYDPHPCNGSGYSAGETEDYTLMVTPDLSCNDVELILNADPVEEKTHKAETTIYSEGIIAANTDVNYQAGTSITLGENFHARNGSTFHAYIAACETPSLPLPVVEQRNAYIVVPTVQMDVFPNPVGINTQISFQLNQEETVQIDLFDLNGRQVKAILPNSRQMAGNYQLELNAAQLEQGTYFVRMLMENEVITKMILVQ